ncbi:hypothetical protein SH528x_003664 [Novipirellula sp. SH528]
MRNAEFTDERLFRLSLGFEGYLVAWAVVFALMMFVSLVRIH